MLCVRRKTAVKSGSLWCFGCFAVAFGLFWLWGGEAKAALKASRLLRPSLSRSSRPSFLGNLRDAIKAMGNGDLVAWKRALDQAETYKDIYIEDAPMDWSYDREIWLRLLRYHYHRAKVDCPDPTEQAEPSKLQLTQIYKKAETCFKEFQQAVSHFQRYFRALCGYRCLSEEKKRDPYTQQGMLRMEALQFQLYLLRDYERVLFKTLWFRPLSIWRTVAWKKKMATWRAMLTHAGILSPWVKRKRLRKRKAKLLATTLRTFRRRTLELRKRHGPVMQMATLGLLFTLSGATGLLMYVSMLELQQASFQSPYAEAGFAVLASVTTAGMILGVAALFALPDPHIFRELQSAHALYLSGNPPAPSKTMRANKPPTKPRQTTPSRIPPIPLAERAQVLWASW